jgi:flagellar basal-body rod modification protein FlgD
MQAIAANSIFAQDVNGSSSSSSSSNSSAEAQANSGLNANSFITLLTTQLQAQSPLSPMDPSQMVSELTTMNTLEQLIQIRQDMDTLVGSLPGTGTPAGGSSSSAGAASNNANAPANSAAALRATLLSSVNSSLYTGLLQSSSKSLF